MHDSCIFTDKCLESSRVTHGPKLVVSKLVVSKLVEAVVAVSISKHGSGSSGEPAADVNLSGPVRGDALKTAGLTDRAGPKSPWVEQVRI